MLFQTKTAH